GEFESKSETFTLDNLSFAAQDAAITPRAHHTATLLLDGRVLLAGGAGSSSDTVEFIDSFTKQNVGAATLKASRQDHAATLFADGTVRLWGGRDANGQSLAFGEDRKSV